MPAPTNQQRAAVAAEGNVLLMAGAGTGKTSTLVARVLDRLCRQPDPISVERVLMVTFTEAAAAEMRHRLRDALEERLKESPEDERLAEQLALLDTAAIGTLHSFCLRLVREHFHELGIDPQPVVLDPAEARRLEQEAADAILEPHFRGTDAGSRAVRELIAGLLDHRIEEARALILKLHRHASTLPDPEVWLGAQLRHWQSAEPAAWRADLAAGFPRWAREWADSLDGVTENFPAATACRVALVLLPATPSPADSVQLLDSVLSEKGTRAKKNQRPPKLHADLLKQLFAEAAFLRTLIVPAADSGDPLAEDWQRTRESMAALVTLAIRFGERFTRAKRELGVVDYHDLEQFTLRLLRPRDGQPAPVPDAAQRFDLVFVDECQDINAAQDAILKALSRREQGGNRFLVGDVKQSIYRFRLADPHIFQHYASEWQGAHAEGVVLPLTENFRSAGKILHFLNALFPPLMRREVGGVEYDHDAELQMGAPADRPQLTAAGDPTPRVEVHLRFSSRGGDGDEPGSGDDEEDASPAASNVELEARLVAARLRELHDAATPVWDRDQGGFRPARWGDMAVLLRSMKNRVADFAREFRRAGIPLNAAEGGFFDRIEISDLVSLLQLLDNPLQDLPTLAVLRSPLAGVWEPDELAVIRMASRRGDLWTALGRFHELGAAAGHGEGSGLPAEPGSSGKLEGAEVFTHPATAAAARTAWPKVDRFLTRFATWRRLAQRGPVAPMLERVLDETGYEASLADQEQAASRLANVRQLLAVTRRFDASQRAGLLRFLEMLKWLEAADALSPASAGEHEDGVRLLTVHGSKGLEFPIVAVACLGAQFNLRDLSHAPVLLDEILGLCPLAVAPDGARYPTLPLWLAKRHQRREILGEELRLLYVACTRARDRLLLFGTAPATSSLERWLPLPADRLPPWRVLKAGSYLDWLGPLMPRLTGDSSWHERDNGTSPLLDWRVVTGDPAPPPAAAPPTLPALPPRVATTEPAWVYPHEAATREPAKVSVTGLRRRVVEETEEESGRRLWVSNRPPRLLPLEETTSNVDGLSAAERGTAHHLFLELLDLSRTGSHDELSTELARLRHLGRITATDAAAINLPSLARFWSSQLGREIRDRAASVRRELPFTLRLAIPDLRALGLPAAGLEDTEFVVAQGVIDLAVVTPGEIWIIDFKTDEITDDETESRAQHYAPQLAVYALALERLFRRPVTRRWLHFLSVGQSVALP